MDSKLMDGKALDVRFAELRGVEPDLALALVEETISEAERVFGRANDQRLVERAALEAVIELLGRPTRVYDFLPNVAMHRVREAVCAR